VKYNYSCPATHLTISTVMVHKSINNWWQGYASQIIPLFSILLPMHVPLQGSLYNSEKWFNSKNAASVLKMCNRNPMATCILLTIKCVKSCWHLRIYKWRKTPHCARWEDYHVIYDVVRLQTLK